MNGGWHERIFIACYGVCIVHVQCIENLNFSRQWFANFEIKYFSFVWDWSEGFMHCFSFKIWLCVLMIVNKNFFLKNAFEFGD